MSRLTASNLIRFAPGAGDGSGDSEPLSRFELSLATRLDGVTQWSTTTGAGLSTQLTIEFALSGICQRALFNGITPTGHAPLVLESARYRGSTCGYGNPDTDVFYVYSDSDYSEADPGETLAIGFPSDNLYPYFQWPTALITYDPPLTPDELPPTTRLELAGLKNLTPPTTLSETETGVQLPMRLILKRTGRVAETELQVLNDNDAPGFTGSGTSVTCKLPDIVNPKPPEGAIWAVTGRDLAAAADPEALTGPVDYELWWRIYHGSGDMLYRATCRPAVMTTENSESTVGEEYRDRRDGGIGGGFGTFATTDLRVARVRVEPKPLPFIVSRGQTQANIGAHLSGGDYMERGLDYGSMSAGSWYWHGTLRGQPITLSWSGALIYAGGRIVVQANEVVLCATIQTNSGAEPSMCWLSYDGSHINLWKQPLVYGSEPVFFGGILPPEALTPVVGSSVLFSGSPSGNKVACHRRPTFGSPGSEYDMPVFVNGRLYEFDITNTLTEASPVGDVSDQPALDVNSSNVNTFKWKMLFSAKWNGETLEPIFLDIDVLGEDLGTVETTVTYEDPPDSPVLRTMITTRTHNSTESLAINDETLYYVRNEGVIVSTVVDAGVFSLGEFHAHPGHVSSESEGQATNHITFTRKSYIRKFPEGMIECTEGKYDNIDNNYDLPLPIDDHFKASLNGDIDFFDHKINDIHQFDYWWIKRLVPNEPEFVGDSIRHLNRLLDWLGSEVIGGYAPTVGLSMAHDGQIVASGRYNDRTAGEPDLGKPPLQKFSLWRSAGGTAIDIADGTAAPVTPTRCIWGPAPPGEDNTGQPAGPIDPSDVIEAHNAYRRSRGLPELTSDSALTQAAANHCLWIVTNNSVTHEGENGSLPWDRTAAAGWTGGAVGENLAAGQTTVDQVMAGWDASPAHQANLQNASWDSIGVAIATWPAGGYVFCVVFGDST